MIEPKEKPCCGTGLAKGHGCGKKTKYRKYGLGVMCCYPNWLMNSENGKLKMQRAMFKSKKSLKKEQTQKDKAAREKLKTRTDYENDLQKEINTIVRLIDKGFACISSRKPLNAKYDAGHLYSRGGNPELRYNLFNIFAQSVHANQYLSGDPIRFLEGIRHFYGPEVVKYVESMKERYKWLKLSQSEIIDKTAIARGIVKWIKLQDREFSTEERIELRKRFNDELGIYVESKSR